jgi:oxygen-dependent protoporphyrinogen oxidase
VSAPKVIVIGGGISGLATAYFLTKRGVAPIILEKSAIPGGLIHTEHTPYGDLEAGPDSFLAAKPAVADLARQLGIADLVIGSNDDQRRIYIARHERLIEMPRGMVMMAPADLGSALRSPLFGTATKARFLREMLTAPRQRSADVTLQEFVLDHFGSEVLETIAEPLLTGVYGGDPAQLSVASVLPRFLEYERTRGSLIRAARHERRVAPSRSLFQSFAHGMQTLTGTLTYALASSALLRTGCEALALQKAPAGWLVRTPGETCAADHVVIATPAHSAARLLGSPAPALAESLAAIPYSSALLVTFLFPSAALAQAPVGFGFLVPRRERTTIAAATFVSTKFPERIRPPYAAIRCFIVGDCAGALTGSSDSDLIALARADLARWTNIAQEPLSVVIHRWPDSMPQYVVGHASRLAAIEAEVERFPGLHLCGNAYTGVGIPDCIRTAATVADRIAPG